MSRTSCFLFQCTDRVGIIFELVGFFREHDISISRFEEYTDGPHFFARMEWQGDSPWATTDDFMRAFAPVAQQFEDCSWHAHFFDQRQRLGLFSSREPHTLIEAINKCEAGDFPNTEICFIVANCRAIEKIANRFDIPFHYVKTSKDPSRHEPQQMEIIKHYRPDFIGLARYMKILTGSFIDEAGCPIINIHHSFLPSFVGAKPYEMAYERGVKLIGATSHYVITALDQGPIIEQDVVRVPPGISPEQMKRMGRQVEKTVFTHALEKALQHKTITYSNRTIVFN